MRAVVLGLRCSSSAWHSERGTFALRKVCAPACGVSKEALAQTVQRLALLVVKILSYRPKYVSSYTYVYHNLYFSNLGIRSWKFAC